MLIKCWWNCLLILKYRRWWRAQKMKKKKNEENENVLWWWKISIFPYMFTTYVEQVEWMLAWDTEDKRKKTWCSSRSVFLNLFCLAAPLFSYLNVWQHPWILKQGKTSIKLITGAPLTLSHGTLVCRGPPVENHWSKYSMEGIPYKKCFSKTGLRTI